MQRKRFFVRVLSTIINDLNICPKRKKAIYHLKDEQEILLRLADSMAGFLRDAIEGQKYAQKYLTLFKEKIVIEI